MDGCDFKIVRPNDEVDLKNLGTEEFRTKDPVSFNYRINDQPETTDYSAMTPRQFLERAAISPDDQYLVQIFADKPEQHYAWLLDTEIKMVCSGMQFITRVWVLLADIEELGKTCQPVPIARKYKVKIQNKPHLVDSPYLPEAEIIRLAGKPDADRWLVLMFLNNQPEPVKVEKGTVVNLLQPCIIYFVLQPKQQTEGRPSRREFSLPAGDESFLSAQGFLWETLRTPQGNFLIIHDYPITDGYLQEKALLALLIPASYTAGEIDMVYFHPELQTKSNRAIGALTTCTIDGRVFQRWSRHRAPGEWVPGVDNVSTHLFLVNNWLTKETNA
jgi:hypothetical protein